MKIQLEGLAFSLHVFLATTKYQTLEALPTNLGEAFLFVFIAESTFVNVLERVRRRRSIIRLGGELISKWD